MRKEGVNGEEKREGRWKGGKEEEKEKRKKREREVR